MANCRKPAISVATSSTSKAPSFVIDASTTAARPAAGPLTLEWEPLSRPTTTPPMMPEIIPENRGAPEASAMPRHKGSATRKTTMPAGRSCLRWLSVMIVRGQWLSEKVISHAPRSLRQDRPELHRRVRDGPMRDHLVITGVSTRRLPCEMGHRHQYIPARRRYKLRMLSVTVTATESAESI